MAKYHNSPNGPRICSSQKGLCPYGQAGKPHFESQREAQEAYEQEMAETFGSTVKLNRTLKEKALQATYRKVDAVHNKVQLAKLSPAAQASYRTVASVRDSARAAKKGVSRLRESIRSAMEPRPQPSLGSMYRTAETRSKLAASGVASRATSRQIAQVNRMPRVLSPYGKPRTMRADSLTVGDRLENKEVVVGIRRHGDGSTTLTLQNGEEGKLRQENMPNSEPIRASRYSRRGERMQGRIHRMRSAMNGMRERFALASQQQREVVNTLRGVGYSQRAGRGRYNEDSLTRSGYNQSSPASRRAAAQGQRHELPRTRVMPRVNAEQYKHVAQSKDVRETARRMRERRSEGQRFNAEAVGSRQRMNA